MKTNGKPLGPCACGGAIFIDEATCSVQHAEPTCAPFTHMDVLDFLTYVRRERGISDELAQAIDPIECTEEDADARLHAASERYARAVRAANVVGVLPVGGKSN